MSETTTPTTKNSKLDLMLALLTKQDERLSKLENGAIVRPDSAGALTLQGEPGKQVMIITGQSRGTLMAELVAFVPQGGHIIGEYINKKSGKIVTSISRGFNTPALTLAEGGEVKVLELALRVKSKKEELQSDVAMLEGVERWIASKMPKE